MINSSPNNSSCKEDILKFTGASDLNNANIIINDKYRDLDTEIIPLNKTAIVDIKERPSVFKYVESPQNDFEFVDSAVFITNSLDKMAKTMGININHMSIDRMKQEPSRPARAHYMARICSERIRMIFLNETGTKRRKLTILRPRIQTEA